MSLWKAIAAELKPVFTPAGSAIEGISPQDWASPNQPLRPVTPPGLGVRQWDFRPAINLDFTPRGDLPISFPMLRQISNSWDLCRLMIETRKDQVINREWVIRVKPMPGETNKQRLAREAKNTNVKKVTDLLQFPDGVHSFPLWLRMWLDQLLVYDAPCIYPVRNMLGDVMGVRVISGATITPLVDEQGFVPAPPSPAYQQVILGIPTGNLTAPGRDKQTKKYTADELIYAPRNPRCDSRWGFGPVEQIIATLAIASRRQEFLKAYYTEGNVPEGLIQTPASWNPDQIKSMQTWFDSMLAGNLQKRRRLILTPNTGTARGVEWAKQNALTDGTDEYLVKIVAFAFSVTPQGLIKQMNRASAKQASDTSNEEGLEPTLKHIESTMNLLITRVLKLDDVEFVYSEKREVDPEKQAQVDASDVNTGIRTRNEVRSDRGFDPREEKEADMLTVTTAAGIQPLDAQKAADRAATMMPEPDPDAEPKPGKQKIRKSKVLKLPAKLTAANERHSAALARKVGKFLKAQSERIAKEAASGLQKVRRTKKADDDTERVKRLAEIMALLSWNYAELPPEIEATLKAAAIEGAWQGANQINADKGGEFAPLYIASEALAVKWAADRALELAGQTEKARWAISDTAQSEIEKTVKQAIEESWTPSQLQAVIEASNLFTQAHADLIASQETSRAQVNGWYAAWRESRKVAEVAWKVSPEHACCDICDLYQAKGSVPVGYEFALGVQAPPDAHPNCECWLEVTKFESEES